jgi:hypothetical protein
VAVERAEIWLGDRPTTMDVTTRHRTFMRTPS